MSDYVEGQTRSVQPVPGRDFLTVITLGNFHRYPIAFEMLATERMIFNLSENFRNFLFFYNGMIFLQQLLKIRFSNFSGGTFVQVWIGRKSSRNFDRFPCKMKMNRPWLLKSRYAKSISLVSAIHYCVSQWVWNIRKSVKVDFCVGAPLSYIDNFKYS